MGNITKETGSKQAERPFNGLAPTYLLLQWKFPVPNQGDSTFCGFKTGTGVQSPELKS